MKRIMTDFQQTVLIYLLVGAGIGIAVYLTFVHNSEKKEPRE